MNDQFTQFKKCIIWKKDFLSWSGRFAIDSTPEYVGRSYSIVSAPNQSARVAKPEIAERLYQSVSEYCFIHGIDLNLVIKQKLLAKGHKK